MPENLSPEQRSLRARLAAHSLHSKRDSRKITEAARQAGPGSDDYWAEKVDPNSELPQEERRRRAAHAKSAHFLRLAYRSARARRARSEDSAS